MIAQAILPPIPAPVPTTTPVVMPRPPMLLTVPQVASELGVSVAKAKELVARGEIRSVKLDKCRRVRYEDLADYVAQLRDGWA